MENTPVFDSNLLKEVDKGFLKIRTSEANAQDPTLNGKGRDAAAFITGAGGEITSRILNKKPKPSTQTKGGKGKGGKGTKSGGSKEGSGKSKTPGTKSAGSKGGSGKSKAATPKKATTPKSAATPKSAPATTSAPSKLSKGLKVGGRVLMGAAVVDFLYNCYDYATAERLFTHTDENGNTYVLEGKELTAGSLTRDDDSLFEKFDPECVFMALYAAKHGLGNVSKEDWADYLMHMGQNTKFSRQSEVDLRRTLVKAYASLSYEQKKQFIEDMIEENKDNPDVVQALGNLQKTLEAPLKNVNHSVVQDTSRAESDSNATSALAGVSTNITAGTREQDASREYGSGRGSV